MWTRTGLLIQQTGFEARRAYHLYGPLLFDGDQVIRLYDIMAHVPPALVELRNAEAVEVAMLEREYHERRLNEARERYIRW